MSGQVVKIIDFDKLEAQPLSVPVKFDFDEFELVELESREEFRPLDICECGCSACCSFTGSIRCL